MKKLIVVFGFLLLICSIFSSIFLQFYYWYSFYVIGAFLFFGSLNCKNKNKTVFSLLYEGELLKFLIVYFLGLVLGFSVDVIYGRYIANLWYYPHLPETMSLVIPLFIYYPFGGLQIYEIFYFLKSKLRQKFKDKSKYKLPKFLKNFVSGLLVTLLILGIIVPVLNYYFNENKYGDELVVIFMILTTFSSDMIVYKFNKTSIFFDFLEGNKLVTITMLLSWIISTLLTEYPNTYSWEWVYTFPFTKIEILKINILVLTFGWFFLVYATVRFIDLTLYLLKKYLGS